MKQLRDTLDQFLDSFSLNALRKTRKILQKRAVQVPVLAIVGFAAGPGTVVLIATFAYSLGPMTAFAASSLLAVSTLGAVACGGDALCAAVTRAVSRKDPFDETREGVAEVVRLLPQAARQLRELFKAEPQQRPKSTIPTSSNRSPRF